MVASDFKVGDVFFHINKIGEHNPFPPLEIGKTYSTGAGYNPFFSYYKSPFTFRYKKTTGETERCRPLSLFVNIREKTLFPDVIPPTYHELAHLAHQAACEYIKFSKEMLWELVREREFKHRPSRLNCIWLLEDMSQFNFWVGQLEPQLFNTVAIELVDIISIFRTDDNFFNMSNEGYPELESRAREYWSGVDAVSESTEVLFEGTFLVKPLGSLTTVPGGNSCHERPQNQPEPDGLADQAGNCPEKPEKSSQDLTEAGT